MLDQEEGVFGDVDELLRQRQEKRHWLRQYLLEGQAEWRLDGGVVWKPPAPDPAVEAVRPIIARAEKRQPDDILMPGQDAAWDVLGAGRFSRIGSDRTGAVERAGDMPTAGTGAVGIFGERRD
eukprot:3290864-Rhodomonas_salina.1